MSCCAAGAEGMQPPAQPAAGPSREEIRLASRRLENGLMQTEFAVPSVHCGACIQVVEGALKKLGGVVDARVNLSTRRVSVKWRENAEPPIVETLAQLGYPVHLFDDGEDEGSDKTLSELVRAVAVAGFAAGNIMLLSVSVWSGAEDATRDLFHWISALIAIPALAYAGRIFYRSAWNALRHGRTNMDVPVALGVSLAYGMSLYETINHDAHAYFDAAVTLLFFLLIGRTLDHVMRGRVRAVVTGLARMAPRGAMVVRHDGTRNYLPVDEIEPGMRLAVAAGERLPVDGFVVSGTSDLDCALVTGENDPQPADRGTTVRAGTLNLTRPLTVEATAAAKNSFLSEMMRLMEAAEGGRERYRRIADRAAALYAPVVHVAALATFAGWMFATGNWHQAMTVAIAVLIITCPCALGLAVPMVQVVAARRLFESGIMVRDGSALERLAEIDTVAFDKTGTVTTGAPELTNADEIAPDLLGTAAAMAAYSRHPFSRAIAAAAGAVPGTVAFDSIDEIPGKGIEAVLSGSTWRLGRAGWALADTSQTAGGKRAGTVLSRNEDLRATLRFEDRLRPDAMAAVARLKADGLEVLLMSGDRAEVVNALADRLTIDGHAEMLPSEKTARLEALADTGRKALMVGDGLNDAPALSAAHVSMAPATAADIGRNAADFVFLRDSLLAVPRAFALARASARLIRQNFALAIAYNAFAVPLAVLGYVTPLVAAVAMSLSSLMVTGNALRLLAGRRRREAGEVASPALAPEYLAET